MNKGITYHHNANTHSVDGARAGFRYIAGWGPFESILDVGCGTGTWLRAAEEVGVGELWGLDGISIDQLAFTARGANFETRDFTKPFDLGRTFDIIICLEVAEHLPEIAADVLIESICRHGSLVFFSAACPWQSGERHLNCQWPSYWQRLFNRHGFACSDDIRLLIWENRDIEPWYRQNMFRATRQLRVAGSEPRILPLIHPDLCAAIAQSCFASAVRQHLTEGKLPTGSYFIDVFRGLMAKAQRKLRRHLPD